MSARIRMRGPLRALAWLAVAALAAVPFACPREANLPEDARPPAARLLGPLAGLAAQVQALRASQAAREGRSDLALARGRAALALDPGATEVWLQLAWHLAFERGSPAREPDPRRRLAWARAGLELAQRGEARARAPQELALWRGLVLARLAQEEPPAPGAERAALWREAAEAFERAARLGHPDGGELAARAREAAAG